MSFLLLLTALSDGKPRHVTELAQIAQTTPAQLNGLWQQAPQHLHSLLRQNDGYWKLAKAIALLPENTQHPLFDVQVQPETASTAFQAAYHRPSRKRNHEHPFYRRPAAHF